MGFVIGSGIRLENRSIAKKIISLFKNKLEFDCKKSKLISVKDRLGHDREYKIVGKDEANIKEKLIYFQSPIGKGLIGKIKGDLVEIKTPSGIKNFEIVDVKYI